MKQTYKPKSTQFRWDKCYQQIVGLKSSSLFHSLEVRWRLFSKEQWLLNFLDFAFVAKLERINHFAFPTTDPILGDIEPDWCEKHMAGVLVAVKAFGLFFSFSFMPITLKTLK